MRTHIDIDEQALSTVMALGQFPNKKLALNTALQTFADMLKRQQLLAARGTIVWQGDLTSLRQSRNLGEMGVAL